ncbi:MAG: GAF domain-containing protein, partial [Pseudomonadota bacterium]
MATIEKRVSVDLTSCEREPIHILGGVQPFGYLIAYTPDGLIARISANAADLFGRPAEEMIGVPVADHIGEALYDTLRTRAGRLTGDDSVERLFGQQLGGHKALVDIAMHWSTGLVVIELEPHARGATTDHATDVKRMVAQLSDAGDLDVLMDRAARQMKALTGFDRVMIYRLSDGGEGHGEVVAEAAEDGLEPFLGLNYPASDIPAQARRLYLRSQLRIIADIDAAAVSILPEQGADGARLDLSLSSLRSVSPIHIEYLRNMGVRASMSVSIIRDGKLWGLFACHHYSGPRILTYDVRTAAELFGQLFALILAEKESAAMRALDDQARVLHDRLMSQLAGGARLDENFEAIAETLRSIIPCDGVSAHIDGGHQSVGIAPDRAASQGLTTFLNTAAASRVYASDHLAGVYEGAATLPMAGILTIPVSRNPRDYIVCHRKAVPQTVTWAGNPEKAVESGPNGDRLMPRSSFAAWTEEMRDRSQPWTDQEVRAAEWLRVTLLEVVLKMTDKAATEAVRAAERQELLIAELNHRVRNILTLIRGVIVQSRGDTD